jgi:hypothetical protein
MTRQSGLNSSQARSHAKARSAPIAIGTPDLRASRRGSSPIVSTSGKRFPAVRHQHKGRPTTAIASSDHGGTVSAFFQFVHQPNHSRRFSRPAHREVSHAKNRHRNPHGFKNSPTVGRGTGARRSFVNQGGPPQKDSATSNPHTHAVGCGNEKAKFTCLLPTRGQLRFRPPRGRGNPFHAFMAVRTAVPIADQAGESFRLNISVGRLSGIPGTRRRGAINGDGRRAHRHRQMHEPGIVGDRHMAAGQNRRAPGEGTPPAEVPRATGEILCHGFQIRPFRPGPPPKPSDGPASPTQRRRVSLNFDAGHWRISWRCFGITATRSTAFVQPRPGPPRVKGVKFRLHHARRGKEFRGGNAQPEKRKLILNGVDIPRRTGTRWVYTKLQKGTTNPARARALPRQSQLGRARVVHEIQHPIVAAPTQFPHPKPKF